VGSRGTLILRHKPNPREDLIVDWDVVFKAASSFHITGITPALSQPAADMSIAAVRATRPTAGIRARRRPPIESQVSIDVQSGRLCDIGESVPGPAADITLLKQSGLLDRLLAGVGSEGDLVCVGIATARPQGLGATPRRKPPAALGGVKGR
jgi:hypothetical protein